ELIHHQDEPIADWVCVPLYHLARASRSAGTVVVQVGEGSDEQFFGYPGYLAVYDLERTLGAYLRSLPPPLRRVLYGGAARVARILQRGGDRLEVFRCAASDLPFFWGGAIAFKGDEKAEILSRSARLRVNGFDSSRVVREIWSRIRGLKPESDFGERMV